MTQDLNFDEIAKAVAVLRAGGLVGLPTETVYGLAADASNEAAILRVFEAKGRPADHPLIVHLAGVEDLPRWALDVPPSAYQLAEAFWPGPLTLILKKQPWVHGALTGGQPTVGVRVPAHPVAQAVLRAFGGGLAAPSANQFTHVSPTTAAGVVAELGEAVGCVLDGGECAVGLESTILDLSGEVPRLLRPGMIGQAELEAVLGVPVLASNDTVKAPGQHPVHYAPTTLTRLVEASALSTLRADTASLAYITHRPGVVVPAGVRLVTLSSHPEHYAHDLYRTLRELDAGGYEAIWVERVPASPAWDAIRDRLMKASGRS